MLLEVGDLAQEFKLEPMLLFLEDAGVRVRIDEGLNAEIPRLLVALLLTIARAVDVIEPASERPSSVRPSEAAIDRACAVLDLAL